MKKKILAIFMITILTLTSLTACGGSDECPICNGTGYIQKKACPNCN